MFKNLASQKITFLVIDTAANTPKTGDSANLTAYVSKDDGSVTVLGDTSATELDATNAPGLYSFDLTQAETNADKLVFSGKSSTSGVRVVPLLIYTLPTTGILAPATAGRTLVVDASGLADATAVKVGPSGSGTAQTARDLGASVLLSVGTGTGQVNLSSGKVPATLAAADVSGNVAADVQTIKTQTVTCAGGVTVPAATLASTTNITAGTITTVTNLTNAPSAGDFTSTMKTSIGTAVAASAVASVTAAVTVGTNNDKTGYRLSATGVDDIWDEVQSGHATAGTFGLYLDSAVSGVSTGGVSAADIADAVWDEATSGHATAGTFGKAAADTLADTNELQTDWANGGRLDLLVDAILDDTGSSGVVVASGSKTGYSLTVTPPTAAATASAVRTELATELGRIDAAVTTRQATFTSGTGISFPTNFSATSITAAGVVAADVKKVNGTTLQGDGSNTPWGPA